MASWSDIQRGIFAGESGGDYNALFNYQNRPNGIFSDVRVSDMSIADVLRFTDPRGEYGQYVASARPDPEMGVATPVGAYQVVGATLRDAVKALNLDPNQKFDKATQDKVGQWIYQTQGTGAWQGYKGPQSKPKDMNMSMNPNAPQRTGLLGFMDMMRKPDEETGLTAMQRFGAALDPLILPEARMGEQIRERGARRLQTQSKNKTIAELEKMAKGNPFAADLLSAVRAGAMSPADAYKALMSKRYDTSKDTIRSTQRFLNGTYYVVTDAGPKVYNPSGKLVTGDEAEQVLAEANKFEIENRALGVGLSEAQKLQQQYANEAFDKSEQLTSSIGNIDTAIAAIDSGAKRNVILNQLPDITSQSAQLTSALRRMGLDVVSSVTFGALSEAELNIAMATAYPPNATEQELRKFLVDRKNALIKLRKYTEDAAMFLGNPNNTRSDWMQIVRERRDQTAASSAGNPYMSMSLEELNEVYLRFNSLSEAQKNQFTEALRSKQR